MRRKIDIEMDGFKDKWGVLQEDAKDIEANEIKQERSFVKEGRCEECGVFDVLSRFSDTFICSECAKLLNMKVRNRKSR
jgi:hypothetical protein